MTEIPLESWPSDESKWNPVLFLFKIIVFIFGRKIAVLILDTRSRIVGLQSGHPIIYIVKKNIHINLLQNDIAKKLLKNKISNIEKIKPQFITTGNIGCITQIANGTKIPILHTVEIIDWYTGGSKPEVLKKLWRRY